MGEQPYQPIWDLNGEYCRVIAVPLRCYKPNVFRRVQEWHGIAPTSSRTATVKPLRLRAKQYQLVCWPHVRIAVTPHSVVRANGVTFASLHPHNRLPHMSITPLHHVKQSESYWFNAPFPYYLFAIAVCIVLGVKISPSLCKFMFCLPSHNSRHVQSQHAPNTQTGIAFIKNFPPACAFPVVSASTRNLRYVAAGILSANGLRNT